MHTVANSERLKFRLMSSDDESILWELDQDPAVMKYINGGIPTSREALRSIYLPRLNQYTDPLKGWGMWATSLLESDVFVGWILLENVKEGAVGKNGYSASWSFGGNSVKKPPNGYYRMS